MYILWPVGECLWETACCHSEIAVVQMCMMLCLKPPCDSFDHLDRLLGWMEDANTQQILGKWQETEKNNGNRARRTSAFDIKVADFEMCCFKQLEPTFTLKANLFHSSPVLCM